jgi:hypothetical protein
MNMVPTKDFTPEYEVSGLEKTETSNPKLARLMKAWEGKQKVAGRIGTFGLMAVGLSACGGSDPAPADEDEVGETFTLTIGDDNFTGTDFADVFNALLASATGSLTGVLGLQTLGDTDVINGGDGQDVLNAVVNGTGLALGDLAAPTITDVEEFYLTSRNDAGGLDLFNASGYEQLWMVNSNADLTLDNVRENAALGLDSVTGGNTYYVNYTSSADTTVQNVFANALGTSEASGQVRLDIDTAAGSGFGELNLAVSNTVRLDLRDEAADMEVFNITGSGVTELSGEDRFSSLVELDSTGYTGDLTLDVSGSTVLETVATGGGADVVKVNIVNLADGADADTVGDLSVDMGAGNDILNVNKLFTNTMSDTDMNAVDFTGGVTGVENIAFDDRLDLDGNAVLDLDGVNGDLSTVWFFEGVDGDGFELALANSPVDDLTINSDFIDWLDLDTGNVVNLTVNVSDNNGELDLDAVAGGSLESLTLNQTAGETGQIWLDIDSGLNNDVSALQSVDVNAAGNADTSITASNADADMDALTNVNVAAEGDARLNMTGLAGVATVFGVQQVEEIQIDVGGANIGAGFFNATGNFVFNSGDIPGGVVNVPFNGTQFLSSPDQAVADDVAAVLNSVVGLSASAAGFTDTVTVTWDDFGPQNPLAYFPGGSGTTTGTINSVIGSTVITGVLPVGVVPGDGFNGLEAVVVDAGEIAEVNLTDVRGEFTLNVTGEGTDGVDNGIFDTETTVNVNLTNTGVTEATISGGTEFDYVIVAGDVTGLDDIDFTTVSIGGANDNFGNPNLVSLTVEGAATDVTLAGDLSSLNTLDLTGASNWFSVNASAAEYAPAAGDYVSYLIGATASEWGGTTATGGDSQITMAVARETVSFTEEGFGTVVLNSFEAGNDPSSGDRIDLSQLGFTNNGQIAFEVGEYDATSGEWTVGGDESDVRIIDLAGGSNFDGEIIVTTAVGGAGDGLADDLSQYNMVYA